MRFLLLFVALAGGYPCFPQVVAPNGGGSFTLSQQANDELSPAARAAIVSRLQANEQQLRSEGRLPQAFAPLVTLFQWPVRQAAGFYNNGFYGISKLR